MNRQLRLRDGKIKTAYWSLVGVVAALLVSTQAVFAADMWDRFSMIMKDIYGELVAISTIVAVTVAAIALLVRMISRNQRAVDEATSWLKKDRDHLDHSEFSRLYRCSSAAPHQRRKLQPVKDPVKRKGGEHLCLTGFLKGIVTWISSVVSDMMDAVSGLFLQALGTDMTAMEEYFRLYQSLYRNAVHRMGAAIPDHSLAVVPCIRRPCNGSGKPVGTA